MDMIHLIGDAAFSSDRKGRIVGWNAAAEQLLGYPAGSVLGKPCHAIICGKDASDNLYCGEGCTPLRMIRQNKPIHCFDLQVRNASGRFLTVKCSVITVFETKSRNEFQVLHLLHTAFDCNTTHCLEQDPSDNSAYDVFIDNGDSLPSSMNESSRLTPRETEVLRLLSEGFQTREVADRLCVSVHTVRTHSQNILQKLAVHNKLQAILIARRQHLI